jgi:hypothetical protein
MTGRSYQIGNVIAVIGALVMNSLANVLPLNGVTTGQVSDSYPNLFTPPGYVFAIWGVIYTLALVFMIYQVRPSQGDADYLRQIGPWYFISSIINVSWLFLFHFSYEWPLLFLISVVDIILLLGFLLFIYMRLGIGVKPVSWKQKLIVQVPISVYLSWISLATIAALASAFNVLLPSIPIPLQELATAAMILVALFLTILMVVKKHDFAFALVVVWASIGIAIKNSIVPVIFYVSAATAVIIASSLFVIPILSKKPIADFYLS